MHLSIRALLLVSSLISSSYVSATTPNITGNCKSGLFPFRDTRIARPIWPPTAADPNLYDFQIDYGADQYAPLGNDIAALRLTKQPVGTSGHAYGIRVSMTRYVLYGRITYRFKGIAVPGVITTAITMSDVHDEIDYEMVGAEPNSIQTNVFYRGITEYVIHYTNETLPNNGRIDGWHNYTIDWRSDRIDWLIDGILKRRLYKKDSTSRFLSGDERWFPTTPSLIQMSVWDGGPSSWSGGPVPWPGNTTSYEAQYAFVDVQCYNDKDEVVDYWPPVNPSGQLNPSPGPSNAVSPVPTPTPTPVSTKTTATATTAKSTTTAIVGPVSASHDTVTYQWSFIVTFYALAVLFFF